jgi:type I restriction enzyme S subunit
MIPDKWKKLPLDHVAHVQTGLAKGKKDIKNSQTLPYLRVANVQDGYFDLSLIKSIEVEESNIDRYLLKQGDVLLTEGGDFDKLGRGAIWQGEINPCLHQNHIFVVRTKDELLMPEFLSLLTGSAYGKAYFLKCSKQSTNLASINSTQLKEFPVLLPPLTEQKKIVEAVNAWHFAIEKSERLIAAKEKQFSWLGLILINEQSKKHGWYKLKLGDICEAVTRKNDLGETNTLTSSAKRGLISQLDYYSKSVSGTDLSRYYLLKKGEFAYNRSSANGYPYGAIKRLDYCDQGVFSTLYLCFKISDKGKIYSDFLCNYFEAGCMNRALREICQAGARSHGLLNVTKGEFFNLKLFIPPIDQQKQISSTLNTARQEIDLLKKQLEAYRQQKSGLMQKLLTGQWRVKIKEGNA